MSLSPPGVLVNGALASAELVQARQVAQQAVLKAEQYVRIAVLLAKSIETQTDDLLVRVDGKLAVRASAFKDVPNRWTISLRPAKVTSGDDPNEPQEDVIVLDVGDAKPKSTLIVPKP